MFDYIGRKIGNYRIIRLLGNGGFANVYLGEHIHLGTQAAIKVLHTRLARNDIETFRTEARTIARLAHPHIVQVLELGLIWQIRTLTGKLIGVAETAILHPPHGAWISLLLIQRAFQGLGYGSEAASLLEGYLFSSPEITQIGLAVLVKNAPALVFWKKRGYIQRASTHDTHGNDVYLYFLTRPIS